MGGEKFLPLTHGLPVMRYGLPGDGLLGDASGLHNICGAGNETGMAAPSLLVTAAFAVALTVASVCVFTRSALQ